MGRASRNSGVTGLPRENQSDWDGKVSPHSPHLEHCHAFDPQQGDHNWVKSSQQDMRSKDGPLPRHSAQNAILSRWAESGHAVSECRYPILDPLKNDDMSSEWLLCAGGSWTRDVAMPMYPSGYASISGQRKAEPWRRQLGP